MEAILVEPGRTLLDLLPAGGRDVTTQDVDPGVPPEGDDLGWLEFTRDGARVLATNRVTDNVTVFDWETMDLLANIPVGDYPGGIATTQDDAIVACAFGNEVYIIDLADYSVAAVIPTGEQPWVVRVSPDERSAYVSCDIDDVCEVIDLQTLAHSHTITGFPISLVSYSFGSENGRNSVTFTDFEVTPDGAHLIVPDRDASVLFFNTATGAVDDTIPGVELGAAVGLSGDGQKAAVIGLTNPARVYRIDLATHALTGSVTLTGLTISMAYDAAVNGDGSKAFVAVSGNQSAIVRFDTSDDVLLSETYTPFWIGVSPGHDDAISGQYRFSIVDFAGESVIGQHQGNTQSYGAVSPVGHRAVGGGPIRYEGGYVYDYTTVASPFYRDRRPVGEEPEGDAPRRVAITPDASRAVVANVLSGNVTIVNLETFAIEAVLPVGDRVQNVAITSDSRWAVACGMESGGVTIIDLLTNTVAADVPTGTRPAVVALTPDDAYAYVANIQSNTISVLELNGASSTEIAEFPCGVIGGRLGGLRCHERRGNESHGGVRPGDRLVR